MIETAVISALSAVVGWNFGKSREHAKNQKLNTRITAKGLESLDTILNAASEDLGLSLMDRRMIMEAWLHLMVAEHYPCACGATNLHSRKEVIVDEEHNYKHSVKFCDVA